MRDDLAAMRDLFAVLVKEAESQLGTRHAGAVPAFQFITEERVLGVILRLC